WAKDASPLQVFSVRKSPKAHGQTKLIEGNFKKSDTVVVIDDVVTRGESTIAAINAIEKEGGTVAFVAVLVDRQEGGREKIEAMGHRVVALFTKGELLIGHNPSRRRAEERRVGKEGRSQWSPYHKKKKEEKEEFVSGQ